LLGAELGEPLLERSPASVRASDGASSLSAWPVALGAVGLVGGAGFVVFGVRAKSGETDLERCSPDCSQSHVDGVKNDYLWSNVSLGVGLAGLVGAGLWLLLDDSKQADSASATASAPRHSLKLDRIPSWVVRF